MFYYKRITNEQIVSVEAKSRASTSPHFIEATRAEYDSFIASLPVIEPEPVRDAFAEIDKINEKLGFLLRK